MKEEQHDVMREDETNDKLPGHDIMSTQKQTSTAMKTDVSSGVLIRPVRRLRRLLSVFESSLMLLGFKVLFTNNHLILCYLNSFLGAKMI